MPISFQAEIEKLIRDIRSQEILNTYVVADRLEDILFMPVGEAEPTEISLPEADAAASRSDKAVEVVESVALTDAPGVVEVLRECELFLRMLGLDSEPAAKLANDARAAIAVTASAKPVGPAVMMDAPEFKTSEAGRAQVARFFTEYLGRHDFNRYIEGTLAADFACTLAPSLHQLMRGSALAADSSASVVLDAQRLRTLLDDSGPLWSSCYRALGTSSGQDQPERIRALLDAATPAADTQGRAADLTGP